MPRKGHTLHREVLADPVYNSKLVTKLVNSIMLDGKKGVAQKIVYGAFEQVKEKAGKDALEVFEEAMNNIMPVLEVKAWLKEFSRKRSEKTQADRLANEIMDAANNTGAAVKRKEEMHRMAEANKAFAHYRF